MRYRPYTEVKTFNEIKKYLESNKSAIMEITHHYNHHIPDKNQLVEIDDVLYDDINRCFDFYFNGDKVAICNHHATIRIIK